MHLTTRASAPWQDAAAYWSRLDEATRHLPAPLAVIELDALAHNAGEMTRRAGGTPVRLASKSLRCRPLLERLLAQPGFAGVFTVSLREALWLVRSGVTDDVVVGYPTVDRGALAELVRDEALARAITLVVDDPRQLDLLDAAAAPGQRETVRVCLEMDAGLRLGGARVGALRSPLHTPEDVIAAGRAVVARPGVRLVGLLAYEAQVAGYPDEAGSPSRARRLRSHAVSAMHRRSVRDVAGRRAAVVAGLSELTDLEIVNGGGTGSLETTSAEPCVTEIAAGSGLFGPGLFDLFSGFALAPAASYALDVVRCPGPGLATVHGGGWIASGPASRSRLPQPVYPPGLRHTRSEGAGEVQSPLVGPAADGLAPGDRVWFRHAKAGELSEHVLAFHLVHGQAVTGEWATYRGEGKVFL